MELGHILTVFSIAVAICSFAYNSNRRVVIYKFGWISISLLAVAFLTVNYLLFFDLFVEHGLYVERLSDLSGWPTPSQWAYIVTILMLLYAAYIFFCSNRIPRSNKQKVLAYYMELIDSDVPSLINYLKKYHTSEIRRGIQDVNRIAADEDKKSIGDIMAEEYEHRKESLHKSRSEVLSLFADVLFNHSFIRKSIEYQPLFFLKQVCELKTIRLCGAEEAVECYYRTMLKTRNLCLCDAIVHTENYADGQKFPEVAYRIDEYPFSRLTFENHDFTCNLKVWYAFGEEGLRDIDTNPFYRKKCNEWDNIEYTHSPAWLCFKFYDILLRQLMYRRMQSSNSTYEKEYIYEYYIALICERANMVNTGSLPFEKSYAYKLIEDAFDYLIGWIKLIVHKGQGCYLGALTGIVDSLITVLDLKLKLKIELGTRYIKLCLDDELKYKNVDVHKNALDNLMKIIAKSECKSIMRQAWDKVDDVKWANNSEYARVNAMITNTKTIQS